MLNSKCVLYKSVIEEVSIWGWPLQTAGLFSTGFSSSSITVLSGRVSEVTKSQCFLCLVSVCVYLCLNFISLCSFDVVIEVVRREVWLLDT